MTGGQALCRPEEIPENGARGFPPPPGGDYGLVVLRRGGEVRAYLNSCPHLGLPLESLPDRFLDREGRHLVCTAHGARFRVEDGFCVSGPCAGDSLERVELRLEGGVLVLAADAQG